MQFSCTICGEESSRICARCTKDTCHNHLCDRCHRCSDCCECEVSLTEQPPNARSVLPRHEAAHELAHDAAPDVAHEETTPSEEPASDQSW